MAIITFDNRTTEINEEVYSTSEVKTNKVWIDGKPIYRKTIYVSSLPNATRKTYSHNISNVDEIWADLSSSFIKWTITTAPFNNVSSNGSTFNASSLINIDTIGKTSFTIGTTYDRSMLSAYVTLCYTKTTD